MGNGTEMEGSSTVPGVRKPPLRRLMVVSLIIIILISLSAAGALWWPGEHVPSPDLRGDFTLSYVETELSSTSRIYINGTIYNYGDIGCYATLHYLIGDGTGRMRIGQTSMFWIGGDSGFVDVHMEFSEFSWGSSFSVETFYWHYYFTSLVVGQ